jgi:hypothetical protein
MNDLISPIAVVAKPRSSAAFEPETMWTFVYPSGSVITRSPPIWAGRFRRVSACRGFLLRNSRSSYVAGEIADGVRPFRIGELDFIAGGGELSRQRGAYVPSTDDSDLHGMSFFVN